MQPHERLAKLQRLQYLRRFQWTRHARPDQLAPQWLWLVWLILAGRGWGKTRTGAEWVKQGALEYPGTRWAVVAPTYADARDTCVEGESGLLAVLPEDRVATWNRSLGELILANGSRVKLFSGDEPDRLRGPQHHGAWCDELAAWRYPEAWDQLQFGLRLGDLPRTVITTTPKPTKLVKDLASRESTHVTTGSTFDNVDNLAPAALQELLHRYEGTRLGRQELYAEILDDVEGALWSLALIDQDRADAFPDLARLAVAVDPAVTAGEDSDETGIIVAGSTVDQQGYVLADESMRGSPERVARCVVDLYHDMQADAVVVERNNGGDWIPALIRTVDPKVNVELVWATRGKMLRAQPVSALYEQHRIHHVGAFPELEDQLCSWTPDAQGSPDRMDALVWAVTWLLLSGPSGRRSIIGSEWAA